MMPKLLSTERFALIGAFLWTEGPAAADWLEIVQTFFSKIN